MSKPTKHERLGRHYKARFKRIMETVEILQRLGGNGMAYKKKAQARLHKKMSHKKRKWNGHKA